MNAPKTMLTDTASIAFEDGYADGVLGRRCYWPNDPSYVAGWRQGHLELIGPEAFEYEEEQNKP